MSDAAAETARRIAAVLEGDVELRREGVRLAVAHLMAQPVGDLVAAEEARRVLLAAITPETVAKVVERHLSPAWDRHLARVTDSGETVREALPEGGADELLAILGRLRPPEAAWAKDAVDPRLVSKLLAPVVQDTLLAFAKKLPGVGMAADGGKVLGGIADALRKRAEKGTEKLGDVTKSVMGGFDKRLHAVAKEFSQGAVAPMRKALFRRLRSDEGREIVDRIVREALEKVLAATVAELMRDAEKAAPREALEAFAVRVVAHNASRDAVAAAVQAEIEAAFAAEAGRSVGDLLDEAGARPAVEALLVDRIQHMAGPFLASEGFAAWLARVVEAAG